jgi:hypothetical protein
VHQELGPRNTSAGEGEALLVDVFDLCLSTSELPMLSLSDGRTIPAPLQPATEAYAPATLCLTASCCWFAVVPRSRQLTCCHNGGSQSSDQASYGKD